MRNKLKGIKRKICVNDVICASACNNPDEKLSFIDLKQPNSANISNS